MKKLMKVALLVMAMCLLLTGCQIPSDLPFELPFDLPFLHEHLWLDATCTAPKTCATCGETEGEALGHTWVDATCTTAKTCSVCKATDGEALGHSWKDATCTAPKTCSACSITEGEPNGHSWLEANCKAPKTCSACQLTEGEIGDHTWVDATCKAPKTCSTCSITEGDVANHTWVEATCKAPKTCSVCSTTEGEIGSHVWVEATCKAPKTCSACQLTEGEIGNHAWVDATCTAPKTCSTCSITEGEALGHSWADATCTAPKTCSTCKETEGKALGHNYEVNVVRPTCEAAGKITSTCTVCNEADPDFTVINHAKLTHTTKYLMVDCRVGQTLNFDYNGDGVKEAANDAYFITDFGKGKMSPFKFLDFGDGDTCEVDFYIFNGTTDVLTELTLSYSFGAFAYANEADAIAKKVIEGTCVELNLAPGTGKIVTLTIPRECYFSNKEGALTAGANDSEGELVSYRDMALRINLDPKTEKASCKVFVSCLSDSVVTESLSIANRWGQTVDRTFLRNGVNYITSSNPQAPCKEATVNAGFDGAFASYYEAGYTCVHDAVKKVATVE